MKKVKSIWIRFIVLVISVAMMIGCLGGIVFADFSDTSVEYFHAPGNIPSKVILGKEDIVVPKADGGEIEVTDPNGIIITATNPEAVGNTFTYAASKLGNYTVTYIKNGLRYSYIINCYEEKEYFISVDRNGADVPTYMKENGSFKLPQWFLATNDDDGKVVPVDDSDIEYKWKWGSDSDYTVFDKDTDSDKAISIDGSQNNTLILAASIGNSKKIYSKEYTVITQNNFEDESAPTLRNISNVPSSGSINTKVTLPKATAEDDYDSNVRVEISVKDPDGEPVKQVTLNDQGYAIETLEGAVAFDNIDVMEFYPTKIGTYTVEYTAIDDAGNKTPRPHTYTINVTDRTVPVITEVPDEDTIPNKWGLKSASNGANEDKGSTLWIPVPNVVDNVDKFDLTDAEGSKISLTVEIKNPNVTVARFYKLSAQKLSDETSSDLTINKGNSSYGDYFKDDADGVKLTQEKGYLAIKINFADFVDKEYIDAHTDLNKKEAAVTGDWTVTFQFYDANNNGGYGNAQKIYTINIEDIDFIDKDAPVIEELELPEYLLLGNGNDTFTVPYTYVNDNNDTRLNEEYYIYTLTDESEMDENNKLAVEGGEELEIVKDAQKYYFQKEVEGEQVKFELKDKIYFAFAAIDDVGNKTELKTKDDEDNDVDYSLDVFVAQKAFSAGAENVAIKFDTETITENAYGYHTVGEFKVKLEAQREFIGFELQILDSDGNSLDGVSSYMFFAKEGETDYLYVRNIQFRPAKSGEYQVNVRIFDANDNTYAFARKINVEVEDVYSSMGRNNAAVAWENNASTRKAYNLTRYDFTVKGDKNEYERIYNIIGGRFSILGHSFTPLAQGSYDVNYYYAKITDAKEKDFAAAVKAIDDKASGENAWLEYLSTDGMTVTDSESTVFELDGNIDSYHALISAPSNRNVYEAEHFFETPAITAFTGPVTHKVTVKYTDPDNETKDANPIYEFTKDDVTTYSFDETDAEGNKGVFLGRFAFPLDKDGTYTITVSANGDSKEYKMKVGDIVPPQFEIIGGTKNVTAKIDSTFSYRGIKFIDGQQDSKSNVTVEYRLFEPGSSSAESSVSGSMSLTDFEKAMKNDMFEPTTSYKFTKTGEYRVEIVLRDNVGNESKQMYTISVSATSNETPTSLTMLSTVLIIIGVLLIIGVVVYLIRFRKRKA